MFGFGKVKQNVISISNLVSVDGYQPGNGNMYIALVEDLTIFRGSDLKHPTGVKPMLVTARIMDPEFTERYGDRVIVVSKDFTKLPKKQRLALLEIENCKKNKKTDDRFSLNAEDNVLRTSEDRKVASELIAMEKYGVKTVKKAVTKSQKKLMDSEMKVGKYLNKEYKKKNKKGTQPIIEPLETPFEMA